jgi:gamma-glutamyl hercynylcysteine S-oxide synthase
MQTAATPVDREALIDWYIRTRARSRAIFELVTEEAYYARPILLRHPIVFYEGHLPAFSVNTLLKKGLGHAGINPALETLFARGIDPDDDTAAAAAGRSAWPSRAVVREYAVAADTAILDALANGPIVNDDVPVLRGAEAAFAIIEHEAMHQETLLYMWHRLPLEQKHAPPGYTPIAHDGGSVPPSAASRCPAASPRSARDRDAAPFGVGQRARGARCARCGVRGRPRST